MLQNPESQKILDRIEASCQNTFDKEAVILLKPATMGSDAARITTANLWLALNKK